MEIPRCMETSRNLFLFKVHPDCGQVDNQERKIIWQIIPDIFCGIHCPDYAGNPNEPGFLAAP